MALKVEPCAEHKNEVLVCLYSTVAPAWGHTDETAKKLVGVFPLAVRMMIYPLLATKSLIDFNSESKLMERPEEVLGILTALGAPLSSFEQDKAKHATHAAENPADVKAAEKMARLFDEIKKVVIYIIVINSIVNGSIKINHSRINRTGFIIKSQFGTHGSLAQGSPLSGVLKQ